MLRKIVLFVLFFVSCFVIKTYADETITIDIWSDRTVNHWDTVNINATIWWDCSNFNYSTIYWQEQDDKLDWVTLQSGWTWNLLYSSTATWTKQLRAQIRCPQWTWPLFTSEITSNDTITINVNPLLPTVNAWSDSYYRVWTNINLAWTINWTDSSCTTFDYQWEQISWPVVEITNSWQLLVNSNTYNNASFVFPDTSDNISFRLNVTPQSCANAWNTYSWSVTYSKKTWWWKSYFAKTQDEANVLFFDTWSIDNIKLILNLSKDNYSPFLYLWWNNIWWNWHINYVLQYSTWASFQTINQIETKEIFYNYEEKLLDYDYLIHYFRLKACYNNKCSDYSNVVKHYTEDYLNIYCNNIKLPKFEDIIDNDDLFLDDYYTVECIKCWTNKKQEIDENKILDLYYKNSCNICKTLDFNDKNSNFLDSFYNTKKCLKCKEINY